MTKTLCPKCQVKTEGVLVSVWINADGDSVETWQCRKCEAIFDRVIGAKGQSREPLPFYSAGVNEDKPIEILCPRCGHSMAFHGYYGGCEAPVEGANKRCRCNYTRYEHYKSLLAEIKRLNWLLELERSDD